jgi:antitoxin PrlF
MTQKYQTTIPEKIRRLLGLQSGDIIGFHLKEGDVVLRKASALEVAFAKAVESSPSEWASEKMRRLLVAHRIGRGAAHQAATSQTLSRNEYFSTFHQRRSLFANLKPQPLNGAAGYYGDNLISVPKVDHNLRQNAITGDTGDRAPQTVPSAHLTHSWP